MLYPVYFGPDISEIVRKIQEGVADQYLDRIFQSVEEFLVLLQDDLLFISVLEIEIEAVDPEYGPESAVFHDDGIVPYFRYRQHRLRIEEILVFGFLDLVLVSEAELHQIVQRDKIMSLSYRY